MAQSVIHSVMRQATMIDYPGRMSALMFTSGCNFCCGFCHNYESLHEYAAKTYSFEDLGKILDGFKRQWTHAVTITGGEPTLHPELAETIDFIKSRGFAVKLDSNGSRPEVLEKLIPKVDYVAMDIKCPLERYETFVHFGDIESIRQSIALIMHLASSYEFRTTLVESSLSTKDFHSMGEAVRGAMRYTVQAFLPHENLPDESLRGASRTRPSALHDAEAVLKNYVKEVIVRGG